MKKRFIEKFNTGKYKIGSFDSYQDETLELIKQNNSLDDIKSNELIKTFPNSYRAAIIDENNNYLGYISLYNINALESITSIRLEINRDISQEDINNIKSTYIKWVRNALNLINIEEEINITPSKKEITQKKFELKTNIIIPNNLLIPGIDKETISYFNNQYNIPKLYMPFTIKSNNKVIGIIGLTNIIYSNKRANLNIFIDKNIENNIATELATLLINDYIDYIHKCNIHNIMISISGSESNKLDIISKTKLNYFGYIPYGGTNENNQIESKYMFQHIPGMKKNNGIILPKNIIKEKDYFQKSKKEMDSVIDIGDGYKLVAPKIFNNLDINIDNIIDSHIEAMKNREKFSIPLGEDKYILQKDTGDEPISNAVMNYSYILLDKNNKYAGYINILRTSPNKVNAEIEVGIKPELQHSGLGKIIINEFYNQLFSIGYASITSAVFEFNKPSIKLHEKIAKLNGIRVESYYINGKLWDMNYYSKTYEENSKTYK